MANQTKPFAIVTGASTGIGYELAKQCLDNGFDILIAADEPAIEEAAAKLRGAGGSVDAVQADLSGLEGVDKLYAAAKGRPVAALLANAGVGSDTASWIRTPADWRRVVDTNIVRAPCCCCTRSVAGHARRPRRAAS